MKQLRAKEGTQVYRSSKWQSQTQTHFWHQVIFLFYFTLYEDKLWYFLLIRTSSSIFFKEKKLSMWLKYKCNLRLRNTAITAAKSLHSQVNSRKQSQAILPLKIGGTWNKWGIEMALIVQKWQGGNSLTWPWRKTLRIKFLQSIYKSIYLQSGIYDNHLVGSRWEKWVVKKRR